MCPVKIRKVDGYQVSHGGKVSAKSTTLAKAKGQKRFLLGLAHGMIPRDKKKTNTKKSTSRSHSRSSSKGGGSRSRSKR